MRVVQRVIGLGVAFGLVGAVLVGVEAQTPNLNQVESEPGVAGDPKGVLSRVQQPTVSPPDLSIPKGDFSGMPGVRFGGDSIDPSQRLPWKMGVVRPNGDPVRRVEGKKARGVDLGSTVTMGDDDRRSTRFRRTFRQVLQRSHRSRRSLQGSRAAPTRTRGLTKMFP